MLVKAFLANTTLDATKDLIHSIDNSDFSINHIVVVPDRFSLQMEKLLLDILPNKALFNVKVVGLSSLAVFLLKKLNIKADILTRGDCLLITQNAIEECKSELLTFNKWGISFCHEVYKLISQLKSSKIRPEDLNSGAQNLTGEKYHDIALIYNEYEKMLGENLDANKRLKLVTESIKEYKELQNTIIYFAQFDSFTKEGYDLIKSLLPIVKEVCVSIAVSKSLGNDYIYEKDILQKLTVLSKDVGCNISVINNEKSTTEVKSAIIKGVYSYEKVKTDNNGFYFSLSNSSVNEECLMVAKLIYYYITQGYNYKDIYVCCGEFDKYKDELNDCFSLFDIPCYIDSSVTADNTLLSRLILSFFEVIISGYSKESILFLLSSPFFENNDTLIELCQKYTIDDKLKFIKYIKPNFIEAKFIDEIEKCRTAREFEDVILNICSHFQIKYEKIDKKLLDNDYIKEEKINIQIKEIILSSISLISKYKTIINIDEYLKTLKLLLSFSEVSTVPAFCDAVMISDAQEGFFDEIKIIIILGAQGLPVYNNDNGLLNDDDISLNFIDKKIEPTIRMINRRNRFKIFNLLTLATDKLIISYQLINDEGKQIEMPTFIDNLNEIFSQRTIRITKDNIVNSNKNSFLLQIGNRYNFVTEFNKYLSNEEKKLFSIKDVVFHKSNSISNAKDVFFKNNKLRVTQLETYFSCPFKHFATYGLELKEKQLYQLDAKDIGNICHLALEFFVKEIIKSKYKFVINIDEFINNIFLSLIDKLELKEKFNATTEKDILEKYIKYQLKIVLNDCYEQIKVSCFRPKLLEKKVENFLIGKNQIELVGKADRIDETNNYFTIIDYKTGKTGNILKELYYGNKLQLFLYQKIFTKLLNKEIAGLFYFNARVEYLKNEDEKFILKGIIKNDENIINKIDSNLKIYDSSRIIDVYKDNKIYKGSAIAKDCFEVYGNYAQMIADKATDEIIEGYIEPKPNESSCNFCPFRSICNYENLNGKRKEKKISNFEFLGDMNGKSSNE